MQRGRRINMFTFFGILILAILASYIPDGVIYTIKLIKFVKSGRK